MNQQYMNVLRKLRRTHQRLDYIRYAHSQQKKKAEHARLNRITNSLLSQMHNLEERKFVLEQNIPANRLNNLRKGSLLLGAQRLARKALQAVRRRKMLLMARRAISSVGHHSLSRAQVMRFFQAPTPTPTPRVRTRIGTVTRSMARRRVG